MAPAVVLPPKHIPTWKRLGLKLKYAKDVDEGESPLEAYSSPHHAVEGPNRKRKSLENGVINGVHSPSEPAAKKVKTNTTNEPLQNGAKGTPSSYGKKRSSSLSSSRDPDTPRGKSKSVSFTPETKEEDGDSVRAIHKKWIAIQKAKDSNFDASKLNPALQAVDAQQLTSNPYKQGNEQAFTPYTPKAPSPSIQPKSKEKQKDLATKIQRPESSLEAKQKQTKQRKKDKKPKHQTSTPPIPSQPYTPPHLTYLTTHHSSPSTWKFSKSHQNHILKHLFSPDHNNDDNHIPPSYDPLLLSYLSGLKGFDARQRIREQALQVRQEDEAWLSSLDAEDLPSSSAEPITTHDHHGESSSSHPAQDSEPSPSSNDATSTMAPNGSLQEAGERGERGEPGRPLRHRADYEAAVSRLRNMLRQHQTEREEREWAMPGGGSDQWNLRLRKRRRAEVVLWGVGEVAEQRREVKPPLPVPVVARQQVNGFAGGMMMVNGANGRGIVGGTQPLGRDEGKMRGTIPAMAGNVGKKIVFGGGEGGMHGGPNGSATATAAASLGAESSMSEERRRRMNGMDSTGSGIREINGGVSNTAMMKKPKRGRKLRAVVRSGVPDDDDSSSSSSGGDDSDGDGRTNVRRPRQEKPVQRQLIRPAVLSHKEQVARSRSLLSSSSESGSDEDDSDSGGSGSDSGSGSSSGSGSGSGSVSGSSDGSGGESD